VTPVLWHIPISHYSEKARWALAHKGVEHERRAPLPGAHIAVALWLTRGRHKTLPVLELGSALVNLRYGPASERGADEARGKVLAAFDRL